MIGSVVTAAMTNRRVLEPVEAHILLIAGAALLMAASRAALFPRAVAYPLALLGVWLAASLLYRGFVLRARRHRPD